MPPCPNLPGARSPATLRRYSPAELATRLAELERALPGWTVRLASDGTGMVDSIETAEPSLVAPGTRLADAEIARVNAIVADHRDVFGVVDPEREKLIRFSDTGAGIVESLEDDPRSIAVLQLSKTSLDRGPIKLYVSSHLVPLATCATFGVEPLLRSLVGKQYEVRTEWTRRMRDCFMGGCDQKSIAPDVLQIRLRREDLRVAHMYTYVEQPEAWQAHHVLCIHLSESVAPSLEEEMKKQRDDEPFGRSGRRTVKPLAGAPALPIAIDAMTGKPVPPPVECEALRGVAG